MATQTDIYLAASLAVLAGGNTTLKLEVTKSFISSSLIHHRGDGWMDVHPSPLCAAFSSLWLPSGMGEPGNNGIPLTHVSSHIGHHLKLLMHSCVKLLLPDQWLLPVCITSYYLLTCPSVLDDTRFFNAVSTRLTYSFPACLLTPWRTCLLLPFVIPSMTATLVVTWNACGVCNHLKDKERMEGAPT